MEALKYAHLLAALNTNTNVDLLHTTHISNTNKYTRLSWSKCSENDTRKTSKKELVFFVCLVVCLFGCLFGWLVGWLVGWILFWKCSGLDLVQGVKKPRVPEENPPTTRQESLSYQAGGKYQTKRCASQSVESIRPRPDRFADTLTTAPRVASKCGEGALRTNMQHRCRSVRTVTPSAAWSRALQDWGNSSHGVVASPSVLGSQIS
jgi:hypothetical protein